MEYVVFFTTFDENDEIVAAIDVIFSELPSIEDMSGVLSLICSNAKLAIVSVHNCIDLDLIDIYEVSIIDG